MLYGAGWKGLVAFFSCESFFLGRCNDLSVAYEARGAVVVEGRYPEKVACGQERTERVDGRRAKIA